MEFNLQDSIAILERTPRVLQAMLDGLPETWSLATEGESTWSAYDVVGHLIHGERTDWMPRLAIILEHGEARPFDPYDRFAQFRDSQGKSLEELLELFRELPEANLALLRSMNLDDAQLVRRGTHPALGPVNLAELLATWTAHDLNHIWQIARTMARQYSAACGPWRQYLGVMRLA